MSEAVTGLYQSEAVTGLYQSEAVTGLYQSEAVTGLYLFFLVSVAQYIGLTVDTGFQQLCSLLLTLFVVLFNNPLKLLFVIRFWVVYYKRFWSGKWTCVSLQIKCVSMGMYVCVCVCMYVYLCTIVNSSDQFYQWLSKCVSMISIIKVGKYISVIPRVTHHKNHCTSRR